MEEQTIVRKFVESLNIAQSALESAQKWAEMLADNYGVEPDSIAQKVKESDLDMTNYEDEKVVEGIFDGQNMLDSDGKTYPVPANYASKSKLIEGDKLKLIIKPNGSFVFKQIELVPRQLITGTVIMDGSQYKILGDDGLTYGVLYASITFYRANVGDKVSVLVPEGGEKAKWAAMENVIPDVGK